MVAAGGSSSKDDSFESDVQRCIDTHGFGRYQWRLLGIAGIGWATDGMEMFVMALILPELSREWQLSAERLGTLGGAVFGGMGLGAWFWGSMSDKHGRLRSYAATLLIALAFGLASSLSQNFWGLLLTRVGFGFGVGGFLPVCTALFVESVPCSTRAYTMAGVNNLFTVGACFEALLGMLILPTLGWRWLLVFSVSPLLISLLATGALQESPEWLLVSGRPEAAQAALQKMMVINRVPPGDIPAHLTPVPKPKHKGELSALFNEHTRLTCVLCSMWFLVAFSYYGAVFVLPTWLNAHSDSEYLGVLLSAAAEFPGNLLAAYLCNRIGGKMTLMLFFLLGAITALCCGLVADGLVWTWLMAFACLLKFVMAGAFCTIIIYSSEAYPTDVRSLGLGFANVFTRVAGVITPLFGQLLLEYTSGLATFGAYAVASFIAAIAATLLPVQIPSEGGKRIDRTEKSPLITK